LVRPGDDLNEGDTITDEQVDAFFQKDGAAAMAAARSQALAVVPHNLIRVDELRGIRRSGAGLEFSEAL
jgi:hypothetical protein